MSLLETFAGFFVSDAEKDAEARSAEARELLDWMTQTYHAKFERWLEDEASKVFDLRSSSEAIAHEAARSNVYREVLKRLRDKREEAQAMIAELRGAQ